MVEIRLRVCKGSQKVVQAKEIIKFHNNLWYIKRKGVSKQAEKVSKLAPLTWRPEKLRISSVKQFDILVEKKFGQKTNKSQKNYDFRP